MGGVLCLATVLGGVLFLYGIAVGSYLALALPVAAVTLFVLGLVFWIGWTIATVRIEASGDPLPVEGGPGSATTPDPSAAESADSRS